MSKIKYFIVAIVFILSSSDALFAQNNDVALGTGQIDIPAILKAARKSKIEHFYIEDESPSYATQVPQTIAYLKGLKR